MSATTEPATTRETTYSKGVMSAAPETVQRHPETTRSAPPHATADHPAGNRALGALRALRVPNAPGRDGHQGGNNARLRNSHAKAPAAPARDPAKARDSRQRTRKKRRGIGKRIQLNCGLPLQQVPITRDLLRAVGIPSSKVGRERRGIRQRQNSAPFALASKKPQPAKRTTTNHRPTPQRVTRWRSSRGTRRHSNASEPPQTMTLARPTSTKNND